MSSLLISIQDDDLVAGRVVAMVGFTGRMTGGGFGIGFSS